MTRAWIVAVAVLWFGTCATGADEQPPAKAAPIPAMIRVEVVAGLVPVARVEAGGAVQEAVEQSATTPLNLAIQEIRKKMEILVEADVTTLEGEEAHIQIGRREARIVGASVVQGTTMNNSSMELVGSSLKTIPVVDANGNIRLCIDLDDSRVGPVEEGTPVVIPSQGETVRTPNVEIFMAKTTICLHSGETIVLGGATRAPKLGKKAVILVTARVLPTK
jgi:type II secretory pathway component HofQ